MSKKSFVSESALSHRGIISLVALVACAMANDARANQSRVEHLIGDQELSARVDTIAERIRQADPILQHSMPPTVKMVQWRNYR